MYHGLSLLLVFCPKDKFSSSKVFSNQLMLLFLQRREEFGVVLLFCNVLIREPMFAHFVGRQINPEILPSGHQLTQNRRNRIYAAAEVERGRKPNNLKKKHTGER